MRDDRTFLKQVTATNAKSCPFETAFHDGYIKWDIEITNYSANMGVER